MTDSRGRLRGTVSYIDRYATFSQRGLAGFLLIETRMQATTADPPSLRTLLRREHLELEQTFSALLAAVEADARVQCAKLWSEFDARLQAHMRLEEELFLPVFEREYPRQAESIRKEHVEIRRRLLELGVGVDLHLMRAEVIEHFVGLLRAHAAGEDELLYAWSQEHLADDVRSSALAQLLSRTQHTHTAAR